MLKEQFEGGVLNRLPTEDEVKNFIRELDENNNGTVDKAELTRFLIRMSCIE